MVMITVMPMVMIMLIPGTGKRGSDLVNYIAPDIGGS